MQLLAIVILNQETEKPRQVITKTAGGKRREGPGAMGRELMVSAVQDRGLSERQATTAASIQ